MPKRASYILAKIPSQNDTFRRQFEILDISMAAAAEGGRLENFWGGDRLNRHCRLRRQCSRFTAKTCKLHICKNSQPKRHISVAYLQRFCTKLRCRYTENFVVSSVNFLEQLIKMFTDMVRLWVWSGRQLAERSEARWRRAKRGAVMEWFYVSLEMAATSNTKFSV